MGSISRTRILIDARYDTAPDANAIAFLQPYGHEVDSLMKPVVGRTAVPMTSKRPESNLSNLLSDILVWSGKRFNENPDFGVYNMGGIRASLPKGDITYGDIVDIAPFENHICFLTLTGEDVLQLFREMAARGGEGVSHGVKLVISRDGKLVSALLNGKNIDPKQSYRIATLDYLAQGNDGLLAFKKKTDVVSSTDQQNAIRNIIIDYFKLHSSEGKEIDAAVEGRITIE